MNKQYSLTITFIPKLKTAMFFFKEFHSIVYKKNPLTKVYMIYIHENMLTKNYHDNTRKIYYHEYTVLMSSLKN